MKTKRFLAFALSLAFALTLISLPALAASQKAQKQPERVRIPKEIKEMLAQGLATRQGRQDIPFTIFKNYFFPTQVPGNMSTVFFFRAKNADLGYMPAQAAPAAPQPQAQAQAQQPPAQAPAPAPQLQARLHAFLEFHQVQNGQPGPPTPEIYIPVTLTEDSATYNPDKEDWYSAWAILPAGQYVLAMALAGADPKNPVYPDLKKVGVAYYECTIPALKDLEAVLDTTPAFIVKRAEQVQSPLTRAEIFRGYFGYSVLQIVPNLDNVVASGEAIEVFFFIFGAKLKDPVNPQSYEIEIQYEVRDAENKAVLKWPAQTYSYPLVSQPLPLIQTVKITDDKGERTEQRNLGAGKYTLLIQVNDKVGGLKSEKTLNFEVK